MDLFTFQTLRRMPALLFLGVGFLTGQTTIPDTAAGHALSAWVEAMNGSNQIVIQKYVKDIDPSQSVDGMISFRNQTGGFDLLSVESDGPNHIRFRVKEKNSATTAVGSLQMNAESSRVESFTLRALPPGAVPVNVKLDEALRNRVIEGVNAMLAEYYVDVAVAKQMQDAVQEHQRAGDYASITEGEPFAARLTKDLRAVSRDRHLSVVFNPFKLPERKTPGPEDIARMNNQMWRSNCTFSKVEILPGNIGYLKFNGFMNVGACATTVTAAMSFVAHTDALIFDLRDNGGGDPAMVTFIASYLFDKPTHLNDLYNRKEDSTQQFWTLSFLPGERMPTQPVFVLTSKQTFSGAEEFTYDLKNQKRATIVGETTGGGAHPVGGHSVADFFTVFVPFAKAVNPVSKTDWEGTGVEPDVKTSAADALTTAQKLAADQVKNAPR